MADLLPFPAALARTLAASVRDDVRLDPLPSLSIVSLRARGEACARAAEALGLAALPAANTTRATRHGDCLWVRPDEWWVVGEAASREATLGALQVAVAEGFGAAIDLSASRVALELSGARARDVLASCCPLDLHPRAFAVGACAQSLVAKAPVLLQLMDDAPRWRLLVRPSLAAYVVSWLADAIAGD